MLFSHLQYHRYSPVAETNNYCNTINNLRSPFSDFGAEPSYSPDSSASELSLEDERIAVDFIMDELVSGFENGSPSSASTAAAVPVSRRESQDSDADRELDRLLELIQQSNSTQSEFNNNNGSGDDAADNRQAQAMDHGDLQIKTEPFQAMSIGRGQPPYDFLHPGYAGHMNFMGLNGDFVPQQSLMPPQMFTQPGFLYPHGPPFTDSRRGSQGTTASSNSTSQGGSPNQLLPVGPQSPLFQAQHLLHLGVLNQMDHAFQHHASSSQGHTLGSVEEDADKLCAVCNDRAVCLHYGARTCEGCKGFFKRTVQKKSKYVCAGNRNCPIDKRYRSRCQFCRFQKCLAAGMVKEIVRHGSLSGRRGRLSSKTKTTRSDEQPSPPLPLLGLIVRAHDQYKPTINTPSHFQTLSDQQLVSLIENELQYIAAFLHALPQTTDISEHDVSLLQARAFFPIMAVRHCNRSRDGDVIFETGERVPISGLPEPFQRFFRTITSEAYHFQKLIDWDQQSYCALQAMQYLSGNTPEANPLGLADRGSIDRVQSTIVNALKDHCANAPQNKLAKIVQQIDKFDAFHVAGIEMLEHCAALQYPLPPSLVAVCQIPHTVLPLQMDTQLAQQQQQQQQQLPQQHPINFSMFQ